MRAPSLPWPTHPYIGVTGVATHDDVATCAALVPMLPPTHVLMAGVLVTDRTLRGAAPPRPRYPAIADVEGLCKALRDAGAWPVVHFCADAVDRPLLEEVRVACPRAGGFQVNVPTWPRDWLNPSATRPTILPWVDLPKDVAAAAGRVKDVSRDARNRGGDYVLCDASQGRGAPMDPDLMAAVLNAWALHAPYDGGRFPRVSIAGGLGPDAETILRRVARWCAPEILAGVSLDAESRIRGPVPGRTGVDRVDPGMALAFVCAAAAFVRGELCT